MNDKARLRKAVCEMIKQNRINIRQAAEQCDICYDQMGPILRFVSPGATLLILH
jgi:hypothetical protein